MLLFEKMYSCLFRPRCTRNRVIKRMASYSETLPPLKHHWSGSQTLLVYLQENVWKLLVSRSLRKIWWLSFTVLALNLLVMTKGLNQKGSWSWANRNLCGFHSSLQGPVSILDQSLRSSVGTSNLHNFWLVTNWILCGFCFQRRPNSPKITHLWLNTF